MLLSQTLYSAPTMASNLLLPALVGVVAGGTSDLGGRRQWPFRKPG